MCRASEVHWAIVNAGSTETCNCSLVFVPAVHRATAVRKPVVGRNGASASRWMTPRATAVAGCQIISSRSGTIDGADCAILIGKSVDKDLKPRGQIGRVGAKDDLQPLPNLVTDGAAVQAVDLHLV